MAELTSLSSLCGDLKSNLETTRQLLSEWKSSMADSYRDIQQCLAKSTQEIKESCARILERLEEFDAIDSKDDAFSISKSANAALTNSEKLVTPKSNDKGLFTEGSQPSVKMEGNQMLVQIGPCSTSLLSNASLMAEQITEGMIERYMRKTILATTKNWDSSITKSLPPSIDSLWVVTIPIKRPPWEPPDWYVCWESTLSIVDRRVFDEMPLRNRVLKRDLRHQCRDVVTRVDVSLLHSHPYDPGPLVSTITIMALMKQWGSLQLKSNWHTQNESSRHFCHLFVKMSSITDFHDACSEQMLTSKSDNILLHMLPYVMKRTQSGSLTDFALTTPSPSPKPPNWTHGTEAHPPPPPEPPDLHCCVVSTVRFCPALVYCAFHICSCMRIAHFVYDEMLNLVVVSLNSMFWSYTTASLIVMTDLVKRNKEVNGLETNSQDNVALIRRTGDSVHIGETFANLKIIGGTYVLTGLLHTPPWSGIEDHSLLFSLYVFGKSEDFFLRMVVINIMGCISAFNYGLFCWSQCYFLCTENRKLEIHQDICDQKIFTGWIEHELLSYFPSHGSENYQTTWVQLWKKFREGKMSFVECVLCLKVSVGINLLIAAMKFYEGEYHAPHLEWDVTNKIVIGIAHVLVYRYFDVTHVLVVLKLQSSSDRDWKRRKVKPFVMRNLRGRLQQQQATQIPLNIFQDKDGLSRIVVTDPNGSSVEVLRHGGQIISWKNQRKEELLFMSSKANWKQHKAIRGGISACFARFGDIGSLEQNGFTRNSMWSLDRDPSPLPPIENHSSVDLILKSTGVDFKIPLRFELRLRISLIYWEGTLRLEAIWKETTSTPKHFLNSNLEDKVDFNGGGNVMIRLAKTSQVSNWRISGSRISKKGGVKRGVAYIIV